MSENIRILMSFIIWRIGLFIVAFLSIFLLPQFGNRFPYWDTTLITTNLPAWIWGFGNFDGVHYLRLVLYGYEGSQFSQAFFPLYPLIVKLFVFGQQYVLTALILSNIFFLLGICIFYKLLKIDYSDKVSFYSILLLLSFPTSFYFGSIYSESLFFLLIVLSIFFLRKGNYLEAGFFGALASSTRLLGLLLIPVFIIEVYLAIKKEDFKLKSKKFIKSIIATSLIPLGTLAYMWYLKVGFNNPFYFLTSQPAFGAERNSLPIVLLPQVIFRYIKMLISVQYNSWQFFNSAIELIFTVIMLTVLVLAFKKTRLSYLIFSLGCLVIPTLTGTLSSMPRYVLMSFLLFPFIINRVGSNFKLMIIILAIFEIILVSLFTRGYWIA